MGHSRLEGLGTPRAPLERPVFPSAIGRCDAARDDDTQFVTPSTEELELHVRGLRIHARVSGPPDGVPVLGLHGWQDNAGTWNRLAPLLPGVRLVALDLPGHGLSDWRGSGAAYHFVDWTLDVVAAADALGWERFTVLGHSMGAAVALVTAGAFPDRVVRAGLVEGFAPLCTTAGDAPALLRRAARDAARATRPPAVYATRAEAVARLRGANPWLSEVGAGVLIERGTVPAAEGGWAFARDPRLVHTSPLRLTQEHAEAFFQAVVCPVRLVVADNGWPVDRATAAHMIGQLANVTVDHVPGGHHVHLEQPERVAPLLGPFLIAGG